MATVNPFYPPFSPVGPANVIPSPAASAAAHDDEHHDQQQQHQPAEEDRVSDAVMLRVLQLNREYQHYSDSVLGIRHARFAFLRFACVGVHSDSLRFACVGVPPICFTFFAWEDTICFALLCAAVSFSPLSPLRLTCRQCPSCL